MDIVKNITKITNKKFRNMKRVLLKALVKSEDRRRNNRSILIEINYNNDDTPKIRAIGPSYYSISCPLFYDIVSSDSHSKLLEINRSRTNHDELEIRHFAYGHAEYADDISIEIVKIYED